MSSNTRDERTPFQRHREEEEARRRIAEAETARLYAEFVASFQRENAAGGSRTSVRGGTINPNERDRSGSEG